MSEALVLNLRDVGGNDLAVAGGKGANLGAITRMGLNVPTGFVVTTVAYRRFVEQNDLEAMIKGARRDGVEAGVSSTSGDEATLGANLRAAFTSGQIAEAISRAVLDAYHTLGAGAVAVRSSATAEDLPQAAFAGQQETYLNVIGPDALLDATRRCWASLWTERAMAYRRKQGIDEDDIALAVVVQRMVPADVAGVMFTANPVTGARQETIVESSPGLGEAVVSGQVTPDHTTLRKRWGRWRLVRRRRGKQEVIVRPRAGGGVTHMKGTALPAPPSLPESALRQLAVLGEKLAAHFGRPQDVEWAWDGQALFILQSRPMTALPPPPLRVSRPVQLLAGIFAEMMPERPYPLEATTWGPDLMWSSFIIPFMTLLGLKAMPTEVLLQEEDGVIVRFNGRLPVRPTPGLFLAPLRLLRRARRFDPLQWRSDPLLVEALARTRELDARDLAALSWEELVATVREALHVPELVFELRIRYLPRGILATALLRLLLALNRRSQLFSTLLLTGVETKTLEANRRLLALATDVRADATLTHLFAAREAKDLLAALETTARGRVFLSELENFLDEFGHREAGGTMLLSQETWRDVPHVVLGAIKGLATTRSRPARGVQAFHRAREEALSGPLLRLPGMKRLIWAVLTQARSFTGVREDTRFYATLVMPALRHAVLEMGRRLEATGILEEAHDVFHLKFGELAVAGTPWPPLPEVTERVRALVQRRKEKREALASVPVVDPRLYRRTAASGNVLLQGSPGSPGTARGPVCVVRDGSEFGKLRPGDVLVAPYTNPAWTPLFQQAAAVIVDTGSAASHAAITAREYGIPAVMATTDGTGKLQDGQLVDVDGNQGVVVAVKRVGTIASS